jgi:uncharacterized damage-inducible protein DinB
MTIAAILLSELERESTTTEAILRRVPADKLDWRPHEKSMTLGDLAWHIASIPRRAAQLVEAGTFDLGTAGPSARGTGDFVERLRESVDEAKRIVGALDDQAIKEPMTLMRGDAVVMSLPKLAAVRTIMLNHSYHHRGQLTVYLRLLDVPLPTIYGPSADEKGF